MSYICMYVLHEPVDIEPLKGKLIAFLKSHSARILPDLANNLVQFGSVKLEQRDWAFEICGDYDDPTAMLLLSHDGESINGVADSRPLSQRLRILQDVAQICRPHAAGLEIYLSEDNPYLPDYTTHRIECTEIAKVLYEEYQKDQFGFPNAHIIVE